MIRFDGQLYFANTAYFEDKIMERIALMGDLKYVIVVGDGINQIDATGEEMLSHLADRLDKAGIELLFTGLKKQVLDTFERTGLYARIGAQPILPDRGPRAQLRLAAIGRGSSGNLPPQHRLPIARRPYWQDEAPRQLGGCACRALCISHAEKA